MSAPPGGLPALRRRLADLPARARTEVAAALEATGREVLAEARAALAAGPDGPSGALAASLAARVDPEVPRLAITAASPAAVLTEFGTRRVSARPFLRPAVEAARGAALGHLRAALARVLAPDRSRP